jgi:ABC-type Na+ efflux pump permease subunit
MRYLFIGAGLIGAIVLVFMYSRTIVPTETLVFPDSYVQGEGANPGTLTIIGSDKPPMQMAMGATIKLREGANTRDVGPAQLRGRYQIVQQPTFVRTLRGNALQSIGLAPLDRQISEDRARQFLLGMVIIEFAVILLIVTNAAASTVTREKEDGSLDLLLATPITSRYYIWGKLRGLVSFVLPLAAVPITSMLLFVIYDISRLLSGDQFEWIVFPEALLILPGTLTIVVAFAAILGMQMSLRCRRTVMAVMGSVGIVMGICVGLALCGYNVVDSRATGQLGLVIGAFSPFTLVTVLIDPRSFARDAFGFAGEDPTSIATGRLLLFIFGWAATGAYTLIVWGMYKSMVKNFDMTIRKQSR